MVGQACVRRRTLPLWKALAADCRLARRVITLLYVKLRLRPPRDVTRSSCQTQLISLLVSSPGPHTRGGWAAQDGPVLTSLCT